MYRKRNSVLSLRCKSRKPEKSQKGRCGNEESVLTTGLISCNNSNSKTNSSFSKKKTSLKPKEFQTKQSRQSKVSTEAKPSSSKASANRMPVHHPTLKKALQSEEEKLDSTYKDFMVCSLTKPCYVCGSKASFYVKGFFCLGCREKFQSIVKGATTIECATQGKCDPKHNCRFCLAETFYSHGIIASNVSGVECHSPDLEMSYTKTNKPEESKEDDEFSRYFNNALNYVLDWLLKQGDLLKLSPEDRMSLLRMNSGRARILWMVFDCAPRHGIIKTAYGYLDRNKFSSETIMKTVVDITDMSSYLSSLSFTPQHTYYIKLLSIFHIGKCADCTFKITDQRNCHCRIANFYNGREVKLISDNYWRLLKEMNVHDGDIDYITSFIDLAHCMDDVITKEESLEDIQFSLERWISLHPEEAKLLKEKIPPPISTGWSERNELTNYLNSTTIKLWEYTRDYLRFFFSMRDQKTLLCNSMKQMVIVFLCWNLYPLFGEKDENITDNLTKDIWIGLKDIHNSLKKDLQKHVKLNDIQFLFLTRESKELRDNLQDVNMIELDSFARKRLLENFKNSDSEDRIKTIQTSIHIIMHKVDKIAVLLDSSEDAFPLLINMKSWIMET